MTDRTRVIAVADERGDFVTGDDGYLVYWPAGAAGAHEAWSLRVLADELDRRNAPWDAQVQAYFRDRDASLAEDALARLSPEGVAARAEGIAQEQNQ